MSSRSAVLAIIRDRGPIPAIKIARELAVEEKTVRDLIDQLRRISEPIWNDPDRNAFWWRDDIAPGTVPFVRWKRTFE